MPAPKRATSGAKPTARKRRTATGRKRVARAKKPMSKDFHDLASEVVGSFTEGVIKRGGSVTARDSKNKDAVQVSGKIGDDRLTLRITQR